MVTQGFARRRFKGPRLRRDQCDYILTEKGHTRAKELFDG